MRLFEAVLEESGAHALSGQLVCRWFNQFWVEKVIAVGQQLVVYGKPKGRGSGIVSIIPNSRSSRRTRKLPSTSPHRADPQGHRGPLHARLAPPRLGRSRRLTPKNAPNLLPAELDAASRAEMLRQIHFPDSWEALEQARKHLVLTEFFSLQLLLGAQRVQQAAVPGRVQASAGELVRSLHAALPYALTGAQSRVLAEIERDLASPRPMYRLLHGDVGAGKTIVALSAMLIAVEAGSVAALMAPTQILAEQHYLNFRQLLEPLGVNLALRTGSRKEETMLPLFDTAGGRICRPQPAPADRRRHPRAALRRRGPRAISASPSSTSSTSSACSSAPSCASRRKAPCPTCSS